MKSLLFLFTLFFICTNITGQSFELDWKDSISTHLYGYGDKLPEIAFDPINSVIYVATHDKNGANTDILLRQYGLDGLQNWEIRIDYAILDIIRHLEIDKIGNLYILLNSGWSMIKINYSGEIEWHYELSPNSNMEFFQAWDFIFDDSLNIYMVGRRLMEIDYYEYKQFANVIKLNSDAHLVWSREFDFNVGSSVSISNNQLNVMGISNNQYHLLNCSLNGDSLGFKNIDLSNFTPTNTDIDNSGNFYGGYWYEEYGARKINTNGEIAWSYMYDGINGWGLRSHDVKVDQDGNTYVGGMIFSDSTDIDILITKLNFQGEKEWEFQYDSEDDNLVDAVRDIHVEGDFVLITGYEENVNNEEFISNLLILSKEGELVQRIILRQSLLNFHHGVSVSCDLENNVYVLSSGYMNEQNDEEFLDIYKYKFNEVSGTSELNDIESIIHPNPFNDYIVVEEQYEKFILSNIEGEIVQFGLLNKNERLLNTSNLADGIYILTLINNTDIESLKVIKKSDR